MSSGQTTVARQLSQTLIEMSNRGKLFVFEGPDGVGKTMLSKWFAKTLQQQGKNPVFWSSFPGTEKGSVGYLVYRLHHESVGLGVKKIHPRSLQLFHIAAHIDAIESHLTKLLQGGTTVVLDRFWWSTWVYGQANGEKASTLEHMIELEKCAWDKVKPTKIFLISRRTEKCTKGHKLLTQLYSRLARREARLVSVEYIQNDGDPSVVKQRMLLSLW